MGSAGFRAIHAITNMLDHSESVGISKSKHLKLFNPSDEVSRVIKTLGFDSFLEIYRDRGRSCKFLLSRVFLMSTKQGFDLSVEASLEKLHEVRDYIDRAGESFGVERGVLADLRLVVDEAVTNVILHGYDGREGRVELHMERDGDAVIIRIRDQAESFDASHVNAPPTGYFTR